LPLMKGMYRRAIVQSGFWTSAPQGYGPGGNMNGTVAAQMAQTFMSVMNVTNLAGLRSLNASDIASKGFPNNLFGCASVDGFYWPVNKDPHEREIMCNGCDVIVGGNKCDSVGAKPTDIWYPPHSFDALPTNASSYEEYLSAFFGPEILVHYPIHPKASKEEVRVAFWEAVVDVGQSCTAHDFATKLRAVGSRVYLYNFEYWPSHDAWRGMTPHAADVSYVFSNNFPAWDFAQPRAQEVLEYISSYYDLGLANTIRGYWGSFIASGVPEGQVHWPEYTDVTGSSLLIDHRDDDSPRVSTRVGNRARKCDYLNRFREASPNNAANLLAITIPVPGKPLPPMRVPAMPSSSLMV